MSTTYQWEIANIETKTEGSNVDSIVLAHWVKIAIADDGARARFCGATPLTSVNSNSFTAYTDVTEAKVIEWVQASLDEEHEQQVNEFLEESLEAERNPQVMKANPWDL